MSVALKRLQDPNRGELGRLDCGPFGQTLEAGSVEGSEDAVVLQVRRRQPAVDGGGQVLEGPLSPARLAWRGENVEASRVEVHWSGLWPQLKRLENRVQAVLKTPWRDRPGMIDGFFQLQRGQI